MKFFSTAAIIGILIGTTLASPLIARDPEDEDVDIIHPPFGGNCTCLTNAGSPGITRFNESVEILQNRGREDCQSDGSDSIEEPKCTDLIPVEKRNSGIPQIWMCGNYGRAKCNAVATTIAQLFDEGCEKTIEDKARIAGACWILTDEEDAAVFVQVGKKIE